MYIMYNIDIMVDYNLYRDRDYHYDQRPRSDNLTPDIVD